MELSGDLDMKAVWTGLFAALWLAASAPSMAQSGETADRWGVYPHNWSNSSADTILALSGAASRRDEINLAAAEGDGAAHTLMCMGYDAGTWGYVDLIGAFNHCAAAANAGFPRGMRNFGRSYELGFGGSVDKALAKVWYCAAADQGIQMAFYDCGIALRDGWDGTTDLVGYALWMRKSAVSRDVLGMSEYGYLLLDGSVIPANHDIAVEWLKLAVDAGDATAMANYGYALASGFGVTVDECAAADWYLKAARAGSTLGMLNYGSANESGLCMKVDRANARAWYQEARNNGDPKADQYIRNLDASSYGYSGGYSSSPVCTRVMVQCGANEWGPQFCEQEVCN